MPNRWNPIHEAERKSTWMLLELGRELRFSRIRAGRTQREIGAAVRRSPSRISRIERAKVPRLSLREIMSVAAAVGLTASVKVFPAGRRPVDAAQLALLAAFNARLHPSWKRRIEAVIPLRGDLRAIDELIVRDGCSCAVEAITRLADVQAQLRSARLKQRDIGATRLILLIRGSHANRRMIDAAGPALADALPMRTKAALGKLGRGEDPGADCLVVL